MFEHVSQHLLRTQKATRQVDREHALPQIERRPREWRAFRLSRVINQDSDAAAARPCLGECARHRHGIRDIERHDLMRSSGAARQLVRDCLQRIRVPAHECELRALRGKRAGNRRTDASRGAGDYRMPALKRGAGLSHHTPSALLACTSADWPPAWALMERSRSRLRSSWLLAARYCTGQSTSR